MADILKFVLAWFLDFLSGKQRNAGRDEAIKDIQVQQSEIEHEQAKVVVKHMDDEDLQDILKKGKL